MVEYGLLVALIAMVALVGVSTLGINVNSLFGHRCWFGLNTISTESCNVHSLKQHQYTYKEHNHMVTTFNSMIRDEEGATMVEYGLLVALIAMVALVGVTTLGTNLKSLYTNGRGLDLSDNPMVAGRVNLEAIASRHHHPTQKPPRIQLHVACHLVNPRRHICRKLLRRAHPQDPKRSDRFARSRRGDRSRLSGLQAAGVSLPSCSL